MLENRSPAIPYIAPFATFIAFMALDRVLPFSPASLYAARVAVVAVVLVAVSWPLISFRAQRWFATVLVGLAVFVIWIAPDLLWPGYRSHWLFTNSIMGAAQSSLPAHTRVSLAFILIRFAGCALLVPLLEEMFWRGWMMRWLIHHDFRKVPLGAYQAGAFWIVAAMFASEHGPYWDVGLAAGIIYNWWMVRTRSLADCIVAHAVTNAALSAYVLVTGNWQYWL